MTNANATCLIKLLASIELMSDNDLNPDSAVNLLELAASELSIGNSDERFVISEAIDGLLYGDDKLSKEEVEFYKDFMSDFGLE